MSPQDFSDTENLQEINNYTDINVKAFSTDLPLRYRSGSPLYVQHWSDGPSHAEAFTAGTDAESTVQANHFLTKGAAWRLTAGSDGGRQAKVSIHQGPYENKKISFEWAMTWDDDIDYFWFYVIWMDGEDYYYIELYLDVALDAIQVWDDTPGYQTIRTPISLYADGTTWHYFKLTVDFSTGDYVECFINEDQIDLSAYTMAHDPGAVGDPTELQWKLYGDAGANPTVYIDAIAMVLED